MTTTDDRPTVTCPSWCIEGSDHHAAGVHASSVTYVDLPNGRESLYVNLEQLLTDRARPSVTVYKGDLPVIDGGEPSSMRSLAALLVHAADLAQGLR